MVSKQWEKIQQIFNQAVLKPEDQRYFFVKDQCGTDVDLLSQVISLLSADEHFDQILEQPVFPIVARLLDNDFSDLIKTCSFASFKIQKLLGRGGMGAVFLAEDTRLERLVALKILSRAYACNLESSQRFEQEAKAVSVISHPNIAHIYEFGLYNGMYFFAMEYIPGKTLRELLKEKPIDLLLALEIATQIAHALDAAHQEHITHRDIKPENIILRERALKTAPLLVKVLDFGIAKLGEKHPQRRHSENSSFETSPGTIMGTTAYMSPEQIRSQPIDERTDLWSLGVVLYEMLSGGKRPFEGDTPSDVQAAILLKEPALLRLEKKVSQIEIILKKMLAKEPEKRYQSAEECFLDLQKLKQKLFPPENLEKGLSSSFRFIGQGDETHRRSKLFLFGSSFLLLILVFAGILFLGGNRSGKSQKQLTVSQSARINNSGKAIRAALSPSGKQMAMVIEEAGQQSLFLRPAAPDGVADSAQTEILIPASGQRFTGVIFSPDEQNIYFTVIQSDSDIASLYRISVKKDSRSNNPVTQRILDNIQNAPGFSPDGKSIVFLRTSDDNSHEEIWLANSDGTGEQLLYQRKMPEFIPHQTTPTWSPDGKTIIFAAGTYLENRTEVRPVALDLATREIKAFFEKPWEEIWQIRWLWNKSGFILTGRPDRTRDNKQLYFITYPEGEIIPITRDFNDYFGVSVAPDGINWSDGKEDFQIASIILNRQAPLWKADLKDANTSPVQLTESGNDSLGIHWNKKGIFYGSMNKGNADIWLANADGSSRKQLTFDLHADLNPLLTTDGQTVIFSSDRTGVNSIWRMRPDGSEQTLLVSKSSSESFTVSPDNKWLYYYSYFEGTGALWRTTIDGSQAKAEKIIEGEFESPVISPDNKFIAASYTKPVTKEKVIAVWKIENPTDTIKFIKPEAGAQLPGKMRWAPNGQSIIYIVSKKGIGNLWMQPVSSGSSNNSNPPAKQLTKFTGGRLFCFDYSPDGRYLVAARGEITGHTTLLAIEFK